ncbi:MAG: hypothetical protein L0154_09920, partial [Chloroflexi bacterium]|nr:hypothetical protein [Chloroflexota bacterium]
MPAPPQPDPHHLSNEDRDDAEDEQERKGGCRPQQGTIEERMKDDQREQGVVQALEGLPGPGFELPQGEVGGNSEQAHHDHGGGKPGPVPHTKRIGQRATIGGDEVGEHPTDLSTAVHQQSVDHMDDAEDSCPCPYITGQIAGDGSPPAKHEVSWPDQECERE